MNFKDYFSGHAADYATYRPHYPAELFAWLAQQCPQQERAWDCATGNGQAAIALAQHFQQVIATDGSAAQLKQAPSHPQVSYHVALAENSPVKDSSVDLVTVAQAVHWFDLERFYAEVKRALKPGGLFAIWCYGRPLLPTTVLDEVLVYYYSNVLDDYWTPERRVVEAGYRDLPFLLEELDAPAFSMQVKWTLPQLIGYLYTWSATQRYIAAHQVNPLEALAEKFAEVWPDDVYGETGEPAIAISWPISLRAGRASAAPHATSSF